MSRRRCLACIASTFGRVEFDTLRHLARDEGLPQIDSVLASTTATITVGRNPILLGTKVESLQRLSRALTGAIAATFSHATILQVQSTDGAELSVRVSHVAGDGWIVASWFTDPDLSLRLDLVNAVRRWRAVVVTNARYQALSRGLSTAGPFAFIDTHL